MHRQHLAWSCALLVLAASPLAALKVFVTSASGTANLGTWPAAGSAFSLAAGDAICQAAADSAGLSGQFRAWLSTPLTDAYCRLHNLTGTVANRCGQPSLPVAAGPWIRNEGFFSAPFAAEAPHFLWPEAEIFEPARYDENGFTVHAKYWTGTGANGVSVPNTCGDWVLESSGISTFVGSSDGTGTLWTSVGGTNTTCNSLNHLLCFEIGTATPLGPAYFYSWGRLAFVTSVSHEGDLGSWPEAQGEVGLAAGDQICRTLAANAGLPDPLSFKAWLSTLSTNASDRFNYDGPWMRLDRLRVASSLADLTDAFLGTSINLTETGAYTSDTVWTGTSDGGVALPDNCQNWLSSVSVHTASVGHSDIANSQWSWDSFFVRGCATPNRLYCLQDLPLVFADGFETGSTLTWLVP